MFDLTGRVALVTGAGQNVGAGIARALASRGAVVAVNDYHADRAERIVQEIVDAGGRAVPAVFDVTDLDAVTRVARSVAEVEGPIGILVNNAGNAGAAAVKMAQFVDMDPRDWHSTFDVNIFGVLNCCKATLPAMIDQGWGRIITVSSASGLRGTDIGVSIYSAAKAGALGFTRALAAEVGKSGVTVNAMALGMIPPYEIKASDPVLGERIASIVVGRAGTPEDPAALAVYLASSEASWITGDTILLNGGSYMR